jgi:hypothetical protein
MRFSITLARIPLRSTIRLPRLQIEIPMAAKRPRMPWDPPALKAKVEYPEIVCADAPRYDAFPKGSKAALKSLFALPSELGLIGISSSLVAT